MTTIPLGDYVGHCFTEAVKAREIADEYARHVAEEKSSRPGLRDFSTPRFRIAKLELTIPVVVDDAQVHRAARLRIDRGEFVRLVLARAAQARATAAEQLGLPLEDRLEPPPRPGPVPFPNGPGTDPAGRSATALYERLSAHPDLSEPADLVATGWTEVFDLSLTASPALREHLGSDVVADLRRRTAQEVTDLVRARTVLDRPTVEKLMISPLTRVVQEVGEPACLLSIRAELVEEGFYLRQAQDHDTGATHTIVDFE